ncbi:MAG: polyribonucleotide nucleotidyltransferase [Bacillota bacterium]|jgi:polyribonucleotide nucleotidyltransferase|nr:polyribonucleotide nucleotidyltransferase [Bacillota bacterium]NLU54089.1 polyribonucleotide nucleotidyltransferase [Bacillota bacterium]HOA91550.1 polyribonucleotide nucleotidyltransferase [Bacillota bacterium]HOP54698.1 polyribonucleotide nucleotidyltransferase [Bacillota bacterium]HPT61096.1 polyribonucleotide nucleotidyltransferase [Bacillota bacterium]
MARKTYTIDLEGKSLTAEFGNYAAQANGSVMVYFGDTVVLVTACMSKEPREGIDFFPLLVDYEEKLYAVGKIPGSWGRREGKPTETAVLNARLIDRPIRPLFPDGFRNDVQIVATVLSVDNDYAPEVAATIGASLALLVSDIPFDLPMAGVRVGLADGKFLLNPTIKEQENCDMYIMVSGTSEAITMVEAGASEISEEEALESIFFAHEYIKKICAWQETIRQEIGKPKLEVPLATPDVQLQERIKELGLSKMSTALRVFDKQERAAAVDAVRAEILEDLLKEMGEEAFAEKEKEINSLIDELEANEVRRMITEEKIRPDGRALTEIRPIRCDVGILPRAHGTGMFHRGQTQVLSVCTLGALHDVQLLDGLTEEESKRYIHHYNFPGFSVGEVRPMRTPGRREIGHGALAERALLPVIPAEEEFPYTIRVVSEVLESNGSSSMASVCGSSLALMDAGVPIKKPVAGIAMGLIKGQNDFTILTDIQGLEDHFGDMDFKVAGTRDGITALQMDIKVTGVSREILKAALAQAKEARLFILDKMAEVIAEPRPELSPYAPRMVTMQIDPDKIRDVIGTGGKTIRSIIAETGVEIDIKDDGTVYIASVDLEAANKAVKRITELTKEVEVGEVYEGTVTRIAKFGAFVEILPGKEGLIHISKLAKERVANVEDVVKVGDVVQVKVIEIDQQGRINLSRRALLEPESK